MTVSEPRTKLLEYMSEFFQIGEVRPNEPTPEMLSRFADFCDLLREGCQQDVVRLIKKLLREDRGELESVSGLEALEQFGMTMNEGADPKLWGLPDCKCDRVECVYCGPRIAKRATGTEMARHAKQR